MTRTTWAVLLALYALAALVVPVVGFSLPPCLGNAEGHLSAGCMAQWEASMPLLPQRFVEVLGVPQAAVVTFLALAGTTVVVDAVRRVRKPGRMTLPDGE